MNYAKPLALLTLLAALLAAASNSAADDKEKDKEKNKPDAAQLKAVQDCAKECGECQRQCDNCSRHCADMVAAGKKDHLHTLGTCADCAEFCSAASRIISRRGPMSAPICEGCVKACENCGAECAKFKDDEHMMHCADECHKCAKACREMLKYKDKLVGTP